MAATTGDRMRGWTDDQIAMTIDYLYRDLRYIHAAARAARLAGDVEWGAVRGYVKAVEYIQRTQTPVQMIDEMTVERYAAAVRENCRIYSIVVEPAKMEKA